MEPATSSPQNDTNQSLILLFVYFFHAMFSFVFILEDLDRNALSTMKAFFNIVVLTFGLVGCIDIITTAHEFSCSSFVSCYQCVMSPFPCDWCIGAHRCTNNTYENCHNDVLVSHSNVSSLIKSHQMRSLQVYPSI